MIAPIDNNNNHDDFPKKLYNRRTYKTNKLKNHFKAYTQEYIGYPIILGLIFYSLNNSINLISKPYKPKSAPIEEYNSQTIGQKEISTNGFESFIK